MTKDPRVYLAHILECAQKIELFTADGKGRFMRDGARPPGSAVVPSVSVSASGLPVSLLLDAR